LLFFWFESFWLYSLSKMRGRFLVTSFLTEAGVKVSWNAFQKKTIYPTFYLCCQAGNLQLRLKIVLLLLTIWLLKVLGFISHFPSQNNFSFRRWSVVSTGILMHPGSQSIARRAVFWSFLFFIFAKSSKRANLFLLRFNFLCWRYVILFFIDHALYWEKSCPFKVNQDWVLCWLLLVLFILVLNTLSCCFED